MQVYIQADANNKYIEILRIRDPDHGQVSGWAVGSFVPRYSGEGSLMRKREGS